MRYITKIASLLFILSIPLILFTFNLALTVNLPPIYYYEFSKYNVGNYTVGDFTNLDSSELKQIAGGIPYYFNSGGDEEPIGLKVRGKELFNEKEKVHMVDVKKLVRLDYKILLLLSLYAAAFTLSKGFTFSRGIWRNYFKILLWGSCVTLGLILAMGLMLIFNFQGFFLAFHLLSFTNMFWILDYSTDNLINLFPSGFFFDASLYLTMATAFEAVLMAAISAKYLLKTRKAKTSGE